MRHLRADDSTTAASAVSRRCDLAVRHAGAAVAGQEDAYAETAGCQPYVSTMTATAGLRVRASASRPWSQYVMRGSSLRPHSRTRRIGITRAGATGTAGSRGHHPCCAARRVEAERERRRREDEEALDLSAPAIKVEIPSIPPLTGAWPPVAGPTAGAQPAPPTPTSACRSRAANPGQHVSRCSRQRRSEPRCAVLHGQRSAGRPCS